MDEASDWCDSFPQFPVLEAARWQITIASCWALRRPASPTLIRFGWSSSRFGRGPVAPPQSRVGPLDENERRALIASSPLRTRYDKAVDRESAYEILLERAKKATKAEPQEKAATSRNDAGDAFGDLAGRVFKSAMRQAASQLGRQLARGLMGSLLGGKR